MKRLVEFFKDQRVLGIIGLIALGVLIWFGGPHIRFGEEGSSYAPLASTTSRLIAIIVLIVLWGLNNLRVQVTGKQKTNDLMKAVKDSDPEPMNPDNEKAGEEVSVLGERFAESMSILSKTRFGGKGNSKALYEIPWYIIIGPPGSGKTTALINSGLDFPLAEKMGKGALGGVGGTRNCDWWFTNEAVLIDTAGRYTTQDSHRVVDSKAWDGFLQLLVRYRKRRPINGALIAISIQDIMLQSDEDRAHHARIIRTRIDELVEKLGIRFPIYVVFTKCDLVAGFSEFFEDISLPEREQVWGITLPSQEKDQQELNVDYIVREYNSLMRRIDRRVLTRVNSERDSRRRSSIFGFPQQMESMQDNVVDFVRQTFAQNSFQEQPYLRGIYFSSATQEGTPIDRLMTAVASNFGFHRDAVALPVDKGKSYFINRLFKDVIFPEAELVGVNRQFEKFLMWGRRGAFVGLGVIALVMTLVWSASFTRNRMYMTEVQDLVNQYQEQAAQLKEWDADPRSALPALETLRKASHIYDQEEHPWLVGLGLYDPRVADTAKQVYADQLKNLFLPRLVKRVETRLNAATDKDPLLHDSLLVYAMLGDPARLQRGNIENWMLADWADIYRGKEDVQERLNVHLSQLLDEQQENGLTPVVLDNKILDRSRGLLRRAPVAKRIYQRIKSDPEYGRPVDISELLGDSARTVFGDDRYKRITMPYLFTKAGYKSVDLSADSPVVNNMFSDRWIMGDEEQETYNDEELTKISKQIETMYLKEYADRWGRFLNSLKVSGFSDLEQTRRVLALMTDPSYSPLVSVLKVTRENTALTPELNLEGAGKAGGIAKKVTRLFSSSAAMKAEQAEDLGGEFGGMGISETLHGNIVDKRFREINILVKERPNSPPRIQSTMGVLQTVEAYLNEIILSPDSSEAAFNAAKIRISSTGNDVVRQLRIEAASLPEPIRRWMLTLADEVWRLMLLEAKRYLNTAWENQVYRKYEESLAGRYPLSRLSRDELAMFDFAEFFKVGGVHEKFVQTYLKPFLDTQTDWSIKKLDGRGLDISGESLAQIKNAKRIKEMFFNDNPAAPSISFKMKPVRLDNKLKRFELDLGGQRLKYSHGPKIPKDVAWPGDGGTRVRVIFEYLNDSTKRKNFEGPWAMFRLLDQSQLRPTRRSNVYRVTFSDQGHKAEYEVTAKSSNNPFKSNVVSIYRCPEAL